MSIGLNFSACSSSCIASRTRSVASVQISISFWRRSSSVMTPRSNCCSTLLGLALEPLEQRAFSAGVLTSAMEIVSPACVE